MPLFSTNRGYIGASNLYSPSYLLIPRSQDEENVRKIVARLLGELLSEIE